MASAKPATVPEIDLKESFPMEPELAADEAQLHQTLRVQLRAGDLDKAGKVVELMEKLMLI